MAHIHTCFEIIKSSITRCEK
jgi:hypothetical protein